MAEQAASPTYICDLCPVRHDAEANPDTLKARFWRLHTRVCPMYNSYMKQTGTPRPYDPRDNALLVWMAVGVVVVLLVMFLLVRSTAARGDAA